MLSYSLLCILPFLNLAAISLSNPDVAEAGKVGFIPVEFTIEAYKYICSSLVFFNAVFNSVLRIFFGVPLNMLFILLVAYPLSRPQKYLKHRTAYSWYFVFTMLFSGGFVPLYMLVNELRLNDSILALILPGAVPVYSCILMIGFFRQLPEDFYEAAVIDGASEWTILFKIFFPLIIPSFVTLLLFSVIAHWNSWFDGIIYMSDISKYPLQSYLQAVVINKIDLSSTNNLEAMNNLSQKTVDAARLFLASIPIVAVYLGLQKYFIKGLTLGGVKG